MDSKKRNYFCLEMAEQYGICARITDAVRAKSVIRLRQLLSEYNRTHRDNTFGKVWPHRILQMVYCNQLQFVVYPVTDEEITSIAEEFLRAGADANANYTFYWHTGTLLMHAVQMLNISLCQILLQYGADVNAQLHNSRMFSPTSAICFAAQQNECDIAALLIDNGACLTDRHNVWANTPLYHSLLHEKPQMLEFFLNEYDVAYEPVPWQRAVRMALHGNSVECAFIIIQREYHLWQDRSSGTYFYPYQLCFHMTAARSLMLMLLLLQQDPRVLQESWLIDNEKIPILLKHQENLVAWLRETRAQPLSLQLACKHVILTSVRSNVESKMHTLPLPNVLKTYLTDAQDFIPKV